MDRNPQTLIRYIGGAGRTLMQRYRTRNVRAGTLPENKLPSANARRALTNFPSRSRYGNRKPGLGV